MKFLFLFILITTIGTELTLQGAQQTSQQENEKQKKSIEQWGCTHLRGLGPRAHPTHIIAGPNNTVIYNVGRKLIQYDPQNGKTICRSKEHASDILALCALSNARCAIAQDKYNPRITILDTRNGLLPVSDISTIVINRITSQCIRGQMMQRESHIGSLRIQQGPSDTFVIQDRNRIFQLDVQKQQFIFDIDTIKISNNDGDDNSDCDEVSEDTVAVIGDAHFAYSNGQNVIKVHSFSDPYESIKSLPITGQTHAIIAAKNNDLLFGTARGNIYKYDWQHKTKPPVVRVKDRQQQPVTALAELSDYVVSGHTDGRLVIWDLAQNKIIQTVSMKTRTSRDDWFSDVWPDEIQSLTTIDNILVASSKNGYLATFAPGHPTDFAHKLAKYRERKAQKEAQQQMLHRAQRSTTQPTVTRSQPPQPSSTNTKTNLPGSRGPHMQLSEPEPHPKNECSLCIIS